MTTSDARPRVFAIDPGPIFSAYVFIEGDAILEFGKIANAELIQKLNVGRWCFPKTMLYIEKIASYGMAVGAEVFETAYWCGRFDEAGSCGKAIRPTRKDIVVHLCGTSKAKDANVRQAMIDRYGAPGTKKNPGATFGITADVWQALAVAAYAIDREETKG